MTAPTQTIGPPEAPPPPTEAPDRPGQRIGNYRVTRVLGEGGMGTVLLAEQSEPLKRQVAIKVIRAGLLRRRAIQRFEVERQALARMQHANIAQVFDAGWTGDGQPYFVMEYVPGTRITEYCDRQRLSIRERLDIFQLVCAGVQHAHQKGIIHRDIKPSNILVMEEQGRAVPKIIDFGVAKALDEPLGDSLLATSDGLVGTPAFLSPEAIQGPGEGHDVDTRSDVYSLGVLLYQLLVGVLPFAKGSESFLELSRRIVEGELERPSARLKALDPKTRETVAAERGVDAVALGRMLRGDLDWITGRAMEKDRSRRYSSAAEMASDVARHLRHEVLIASPPSTRYRATKFVRRHRAVVAAAALVIAALLGGVVMTAREARRANREADAARRVSDFMVSLFTVSDPGQARGNTITAREILDKGAEKIRGELEGDPLNQALLMESIGTVYRNLGLYQQAEQLLSASLTTREKALGPVHVDVGTSLNKLASVYAAQGDYDAAEPLYKRSLAIWEKRLGPNHTYVATGLNNLAKLYEAQGRYADAEPLYQRALGTWESNLGRDHPEVAVALNNLSVLYRSQGRHADAEPLAQRALSIWEKALGPDHPQVATGLNNLAVLYRVQGKYQEAESLYKRCLAIREKALGPDHPDVATSLNNLGILYRTQKRYDEAESLYRRALQISEKAFGPGHLDVASALSNLGVLCETQKRYAEAEPLYKRALAIREKSLGPDHPAVAKILHNYANLLTAVGRHEEADRLYRRCLDIRRKTLGPDHPDVKKNLEDFAVLLRKMGRDKEAAELVPRASATGP